MDKLARQYAESLARLIEQGAAPQDAVASIRRALERRGHTALLSRIARAFARLAEVHRRRSQVVLTAAEPDGLTTALAEAERYLETHEPEAVRTAVDGTLIGGWRLQGPDVVVDASYKKQLLSLFRKITSETARS